jgi:hypothetical protein
MNSLIWWSLMWRPGKRRSLFAQKNHMLGQPARDRQTQFHHSETSAAADAAPSVGLKPSLRHAASGILILIDVAFSRCLSRRSNDRFAFFATTGSKSRVNFLELLRAGRDDYVINQAALDYMREHKLPKATIARFGDAEQHFADRAAFMAHLQELGLTDLEVQPDPVQIATEAALWGSIADQGLLDGVVIVSDGAGQFRIAEHALCWVHAERLIHKLDTVCEAHVQAKERIRARIWRLYKALKAYRETPTPRPPT